MQRYRLKWLKYDLNKPVVDQVKQFATRLKEFAAINAQIGIQGVYQNHCGSSYFGAPVWDLHQAIQGIDPKHLGVAFDIRHASAEGGFCWPVQANLMRPHFGIVYVKDYVWNGAQAENVPLGQGRVDLKFFDMLKRSGYRGPISLHVEYHHAKETIEFPRIGNLKADSRPVTLKATSDSGSRDGRTVPVPFHIPLSYRRWLLSDRTSTQDDTGRVRGSYASDNDKTVCSRPAKR